MKCIILLMIVILHSVKKLYKCELIIYKYVIYIESSQYKTQFKIIVLDK
jgi:hypothetical protein